MCPFRIMVRRPKWGRSRKIFCGFGIIVEYIRKKYEGGRDKDSFFLEMGQ
jgi:hypothetical protein